MNSENQELKYHSNTLGIFAGMVFGALAGAVTVLLFAPQSGEDTRTQIMEKGIELRDQASGMVDDVVSQLRSDKHRFTVSGRRKAEEILKQGKTLVVEQLDHVSDAAQAGKKAIQSA